MKPENKEKDVTDDKDGRRKFECEYWTSSGQLKREILTFILDLFYCGDWKD